MTRIGIVGAGGIARAHADAIRSRADCRLAAVADRDIHAARRLAGPADARVALTVGELLGDSDALIVCTPPNAHADIVIEAAHAGIPTLCEKPFAPTPSDADTMAIAAQVSGTLVTLASKFRFAAGVRAAKRLVDSGELGSIELVENVFTTRADMANRWHADPAVSGGGVIMDNAPHAIDLVRFLFGEIDAVCAAELAPRRLAVEESALLTMRTTSGVTATSLLSWTADTRRPWFLAIHGVAGSVEVGWGETRVRFGNDWHRLAGGYDKADCFAQLLADFLAAARGESLPALSLADALANVDAVDAAVQSLNRRQWCPVRPPEVARARH